MKRYFSLGLIFLAVSCTELKDPAIHPDGWLDSASDYSHMAKIGQAGIDGCRKCHGNPSDPNDYFGGTSGVSCAQCHESGPSGHPSFATWVGAPPDSNASLEAQEEFHGTAFLLDQRCENCHDVYHASEATGTGKNTVGIYCTNCHTRDGDPGEKILIPCRTCHNGEIAFFF
ncbi:MAG: hypothetical protein GXO90_05225 [FCB group bacterium]|nr:hypothetical protein [FCB group bacterium]